MKGEKWKWGSGDGEKKEWDFCQSLLKVICAIKPHIQLNGDGIHESSRLGPGKTILPKCFVCVYVVCVYVCEYVRMCACLYV